MALTAQWAEAWIRECSQVLTEHRTALIELDRAIGDADHGENMQRGFAAVVAKLDAGGQETPGAVFKLTAMTLMSTVGGAAGPLYGTAFLRAATALGDAAEIDPAAVLALLALLGYYFVAWRRAGRGPLAGTVVPQFAPPEGLSAAAKQRSS